LQCVDPGFIKKRITELRKRLGVSEHKMSLDLGHTRGYIHNIATPKNKTLPSVTELLKICDYLNVTPQEFFDTRVSHSPETENSAVKKQAIDEIKNLDDNTVETVLPVLVKLGSKDKSRQPP
jgi:transcriptional regulator with XRE-family HTH domain